MEKGDMAETGEKAEKSGKEEDTETPRAGSAHLNSAAAFVEAGVQDPCEDACSICLEPFSDDEPGTITSCNHEYHLQCILEWAQRSKECPLCWQPLSLKDPSSQELLLAVESERALARGRAQAASVFPRAFELEYPFPGGYGDDADLERRIMHHLAAAAAGMSRARFVASRREILRGSGTPSNTHSGLSSGNTSSSSSISSNGSGGGASSNNSPPSSLVVGASGAFGSMSEGVSRVFGLASGSSHSPGGSNSAGSSPNQTVPAPPSGAARPSTRSRTDVGSSGNASAAAGGGSGGGGLLSVGSSLVDVFPRLRSAAEQQGQTANGNQQSNGHRQHHHHHSHQHNHHSHRLVDTTNDDRRLHNHNQYNSQRHQQQVLQTQLQQQTQPLQTPAPPQSSTSQWDFHEFSSFSEAFKSKWAAASSRCRDLTKMTRGFREKLRVRNGAMSDLGVRAREMGVNMVRALERMGADEGQRSAGSGSEASSSGSSGMSSRTRGGSSSSNSNVRGSIEPVTTNAARRVVPTLTICGNDEVICRMPQAVGEGSGVGGGAGTSSSSSSSSSAVAAAAVVPVAYNAISECEECTPDPVADNVTGGIVSHTASDNNDQRHRGECSGTAAGVSCDGESEGMDAARIVSAGGDGDMSGDSKGVVLAAGETLVSADVSVPEGEMRKHVHA